MYNLNNFKLRSTILVGLLIVSLILNPAVSLKDESAVYCRSLGYNFTIVSTNEGDQGFCTLPNGEQVDSWKFLQGKQGTEYGFCAKMGYEQEIVSNLSVCSPYLTESCVACILANGTTIEVTKLMIANQGQIDASSRNMSGPQIKFLSFSETHCKDGICGIGENYKTCPDDCHSGDWDHYCDMITDGICDPDCAGSGDPDCERSPP